MLTCKKATDGSYKLVDATGVVHASIERDGRKWKWMAGNESTGWYGQAGTAKTVKECLDQARAFLQAMADIKIQPAYDHDGSGMIPYPLWIDPKSGDVKRAHPAIYGDLDKLLGFTNDDQPFSVVLSFDSFVDDHSRAAGMNPVFMTKKGAIETHGWKVMASNEKTP